MNNISYLLKKSIANSFTILNLFLGFSSIVFIALSFKSDFSYYIYYACNFIFIAAIIDVFDGKIARKLGTSDDFGREIDSLADLVSFCIVPSLLMFSYYYDLIELNRTIFLFLSSFTLVFGAIRLARFNVYDSDSKNNLYIGLPTPANAILICSLILFMNSGGIIQIINDVELSSFFYSVFYESESSTFILDWMNRVLVLLFSLNSYMAFFVYIFSSILLVSKVHYFKFPIISLKLDRDNTLSIIGLLIFFIILIMSIFYNKHYIVLLFFTLIYISLGFLNFLFRQSILLYKGEL